MNGLKTWEPVQLSTGEPVPSVPSPVPHIREAVPTGSLVGSPFVHTGSLFPSLEGNRERDRGRISRRAHLTQHSCQAHVLVGLDADMCALTVYVEPYALTPHGEVEALRDQRTTYHLQQGALHPRTAYTIPGKPPSHARTILASHTCHHPIPESWRLPPAPDTRRPQPSQEPPF